MSRWEASTGILGGLLVVSVIGFFFWQAFTTPSQPPSLQVTVVDVAPAEAGHRVHLLVRNSGGSTASGVVVEGTLLQDGQTVEKSQATIDYVPLESTAEATLLFSKEPDRYELRLRPVAYSEP